MSDLVTSFIRTWVPAGIAAIFAMLATEFEIVLDEETSQAFTASAVVVILAIYHGVIRALEARYPKIGWLLGRATQPTYDPPA